MIIVETKGEKKRVTNVTEAEFEGFIRWSMKIQGHFERKRVSLAKKKITEKVNE